MRILLLCEHTNGTDGWSTYARTLLDVLRKQGHIVTVCSAEGERAALPRPLTMLHHPLRAYFLSRCVAKIFRQSNADIMHIAVEPYALIVPFLPSTIRQHTVLTIHGSYGVRLLQMFPDRLLFRRALAQIPLLITVSAYTKNRVIESLRSIGASTLADHCSSTVQVVHNAVPLPLQWQKEISHPYSQKSILLVGPVKPRKGILQALEACALFRRKSQTPFLLRIIGSIDRSPYAIAVERRIRDLDLGSYVRLEGRMANDALIQAYRTADLFLLPALTTETTFEGFGLVYLEAAGYGVPSIGPNTSGVVEAIEEGVSGYTVDPKDASALAERMQWILDEARIRPEACRAWAEGFIPERMGNHMVTLYTNLLA